MSMQNNWLGIRLKNNQRGSAAIEFIGMVPLLLAMLLIIWQFFVAGFAVYSTQTAANEAAKVYAATSDTAIAEEAARDIVSANSNIVAPSGRNNSIISTGSGEFI